MIPEAVKEIISGFLTDRDGARGFSCIIVCCNLVGVYLSKAIFSVNLLIHVQVITKKCRHYVAGNKLLNDLLTIIYLCIRMLIPF
jgi:hypothetical protein